jgi:hypothetical protein
MRDILSCITAIVPGRIGAPHSQFPSSETHSTVGHTRVPGRALDSHALDIPPLHVVRGDGLPSSHPKAARTGRLARSVTPA